MKLTRLAMIEPLGLQIGVWPKRCAPQELHDLLFGDLPVRDLPDQDARPSGSWAVLDAARLPNLPEELESSDLPHRCLFRGKAQQDWGHVAPWLVALRPDARLTRRLFTADPPFGLWPQAAAMFLRSRQTMDDLWRHFRKFTRIEDGSGAWLYFRFWEAQSVQMLQKSAASLPDARRFFLPCQLVLAPLPDQRECLLVQPRTFNASVLAPVALDDIALQPKGIEACATATVAGDAARGDTSFAVTANRQATSAQNGFDATVPPVSGPPLSEPTDSAAPLSVAQQLPPLLLQQPLDDLREAVL